jgi:EH domain-containing protein 1
MDSTAGGSALAERDRKKQFLLWFQAADTDHDGRLTGADAVKFFERSGLPRDQLAKVWAMADSSRKGYLDQHSFAMAMEYISVSQQVGDLSHALYDREKGAGHVGEPMMAGIHELLHKLGLDEPEHNPFTDSPPAQESPRPVVQESTSFFTRKRKMTVPPKKITGIIDGLKQVYFSKIRPLEEAYKFGHFFSPLMTESDFEAKPSVLLLGQYSTGKTTFIKFLLGREDGYPGINIGPEPTTDRFVVVESGLEERRTPGNTLVVQSSKPYQGLAIYGNGFCSKFEAASCPNELLNSITLVDTPGVLSGEKQRIERTYDFIDVCGWFAARCDLILLMFDPHKLDISDEFKAVISTLKGHDDKVRVVLNKSDQVDQQQLMRVYGALMWSLGKVFRSPEVCRVYIGSFNGLKPIREDINPNCVPLFQKEQADLLTDLYEIPSRSCDRKVNEFVKRVRAARIHILIMGHLRKQMPSMMGKAKAQARLLANLGQEFAHVQREHQLPPGDFPDVQRYREILEAYDLSSFPQVSKANIQALDTALGVDIPKYVEAFENPF